MTETLGEFLSQYDPDGTRVVYDLDVERDEQGNHPFIIVRAGKHVMVLSPMALPDHLCLDVYPFVDEQDARVAAFGMGGGTRVQFPDTGHTSHGWPAMKMVAVLLGEQA